MSDDLVKRLRGEDCVNCVQGMCVCDLVEQAADRIEQLEALLDEEAFSQTLFDAVVNQRNRANARIEQLEAALREIAENDGVKAGPEKDMYRRWRRVATDAIDIARAALEGKKDD